MAVGPGVSSLKIRLAEKSIQVQLVLCKSLGEPGAAVKECLLFRLLSVSFFLGHRVFTNIIDEGEK
jgi:hypothetical protein